MQTIPINMVILIIVIVIITVGILVGFTIFLTRKNSMIPIITIRSKALLVDLVDLGYASYGDDSTIHGYVLSGNNKYQPIIQEQINEMYLPPMPAIIYERTVYDVRFNRIDRIGIKVGDTVTICYKPENKSKIWILPPHFLNWEQRKQRKSYNT